MCGRGGAQVASESCHHTGCGSGGAAGVPPTPLARTHLTTLTLAALLQSRADGSSVLETPRCARWQTLPLLPFLGLLHCPVTVFPCLSMPFVDLLGVTFFDLLGLKLYEVTNSVPVCGACCCIRCTLLQCHCVVLCCMLLHCGTWCCMLLHMLQGVSWCCSCCITNSVPVCVCARWSSASCGTACRCAVLSPQTM